MAKKYDASSIKVLELDIERVQAQPHIYLPDKHLAGCLHLIREIKDNSDDEAMHPDVKDKTVIVKFNEITKEVTIKDHGRGLPIEKMKELCEVLHSSGKFEKGENSAYQYSGGMHGVGLKLVIFLSDYCTVTSVQNGKKCTRKYKEGIFDKEEIESVDKKKHGTTVTFKISSKFLKDTEKLTCKKVMKTIEEKADACPGLVTEFKGIDKNGDKVEKTFIGLSTMDLINKYNKITSKTWEMESSKGDLKVRIAFGYDVKADEGDNIMGWTNFIYNKDGGKHCEAIVSTLHDVIGKYMKKSYLNEKEKKSMSIKREDIRLGLCAVVVILTTTTEDLFKGQYKEYMDSDDIGQDISELFTKFLKKLSDTDMKSLASIVKNNIKARESSQRARATVKKAGNGISADKIEKYVRRDMMCDIDYTELFLCEGDSASNAVASAKLPFQEIYKMRGKVVNIYDEGIKNVTKHKVVDDISRIIELQPGRRGTLKHDRVLGLTDSD